MRVVIAGTGCGEQSFSDALKAQLKAAQVVIGFKRAIDEVEKFDCSKTITVSGIEELIKTIAGLGCGSVCVLVSGDSGFFSAAPSLCEALKEHEVRLLPGVSSVQALAAAINRPWQGWSFFSAHGRNINVCQAVSQNAETAFLCDNQNTPQALCQSLCEGGLKDVFAAVGENLGAENERVLCGAAEKIAAQEFSALSVLYIENKNVSRRVKIGLFDESFCRGSLPMTKSEVRAVALSKLRLNRDDILWDIGAGTGSVTVEAALLLSKGTVYAVEKKREGIELIKKNALNHGAYNVECILGEVPEILKSLPAPDCVFIGGSTGRLSDIITAALSKNPNARIAFTAVSLETLCDANAVIKSGLIKSPQIISLAVSCAKTLGEHNLFVAQNPVYIISGGGKNEA